jgi:thioredoxin 1
VKKLADEIEKLIESGVPVLLEFYADWCAPCQLASPILEELANEFKSRIKFVRVNVDMDSALVEKYEIYSIPTVVIIQKGKEISRLAGAKTKDQYQQAITLLKPNLARNRPKNKPAKFLST